MGWDSVCKVLQKQTHDFISHRHGTIILVVGALLIIVSAFQFGEVALEWSTEKYAAVFNSFSDNIAGKSFRTRLCLPVPIDVVYTWVNGSDPKLLAELRRQKMLVEQQLNESSTISDPGDKCSFSNCVPAYGVILEPALPQDVSVSQLAAKYPAYKQALRVFNSVNPANSANVTVIMFDNMEQGVAALNTSMVIDGKNVTVKKAYYTSDWTLPNAVILHDVLMMTGFPHTMEKDDLFKKIPSKYQKSITRIDLHTDQGVAIITIPVTEHFEAMLKNSNISIENKEPTLTSANLVWDLKDYSLSEDVASSRYEDNEELRYSLRSIEQYAPWVHHVYIVTNGQIPGWLNLDNPRLTVVTHEEIFVNKSHLPTFSSPAIEAHLHRIPGLSDKFLYLNDDVMFGKEVWPDDFYTHSQGQKIYLSWPVPNCQEGCPSSWIRDGYCDKACNNSECEWDGGDCKDGGTAPRLAFDGLQDFGGYPHDGNYCNSGCANNWIADRYCDNACNVYQCGFDAGDCGTERYSMLYGEPLLKNKTHYVIPQGKIAFYFNISTLLGENGTITSTTYSEAGLIRAVAVALKFKVFTIVTYNNKSAEKVNFTVNGIDNQSGSFQFNFSVAIDTRILPKAIEEPKVHSANASQTSLNETKLELLSQFENIPEELRLPHAVNMALDDSAIMIDVNLSLYELPEDIHQRWHEIETSFEQGELTEKGFRYQRGLLWLGLLKELSAKGLTPTKRNLTVSAVAVHDKAVMGQVNESGRVNNQSQVKGRENLLSHDDTEAMKANEEYVEQKGKAFGQLSDTGQLKYNNGSFPKELKSANAFLLNISSKLRSINISRERLEAKQSKLILQEPVENIMNVHGQNEQVHISDQDDLQQDQNQEDSFKGRKLNSFNLGENVMSDNEGFLPWEKQSEFIKLQKQQEARLVTDSYQVHAAPRRRLLDTFGDSLRHVNKLYNKKYGYLSRKVPSHMPHMIDKNIMAELQEKFPHEWDVTSSHKIRSSDDMQYMFSYVYYLMSEPQPLTVKDVFDEMDFDKSGVLSDREIRTLATRLFDPPLDLHTLTQLEEKFANCSKYASEDPTMAYLKQEKYYESIMPQVTLYLIEHCEPVIHLFEKAFKARTKYRYEVVNEDEVAFKMIGTNVSKVVGQLDDIRRHPKKFVCLNDNIDHSKDEAKTVKAVLVDFYESLYPIPSSFELPREYRNRFLHMDELRHWRRYRDWLKLWTQIALIFLVLFTVASFFSDKIEALQKKYFGRRRPKTSDESSVSQRLLEAV